MEILNYDDNKFEAFNAVDNKSFMLTIDRDSLRVLLFYLIGLLLRSGVLVKLLLYVMLALKPLS
jgi:hypothetical protein